MGTSLAPSREEGRCLELLDARAGTWGSAALLAGGGHARRWDILFWWVW